MTDAFRVIDLSCLFASFNGARLVRPFGAEPQWDGRFGTANSASDFRRRSSSPLNLGWPAPPVILGRDPRAIEQICISSCVRIAAVAMARTVLSLAVPMEAIARKQLRPKMM